MLMRSDLELLQRRAHWWTRTAWFAMGMAFGSVLSVFAQGLGRWLASGRWFS